MKASKPFIEAGPAATKGLLALDLPLTGRPLSFIARWNREIRHEGVDLCDPSFIDAALKLTS